jgi:hypothetical protein
MAAWPMRLLSCTQRVCKHPVALDPVTELLPAASSDQLFAIFAPMASVVAAYMAVDPVELLVIVHNLRTDRCTDHQWLTKFFRGRLAAPFPQQP